MAGFNRNVITQADVDHYVESRRGTGLIPASFAESPPTVATGVSTPTADDYVTKLLKYVPLEVLGFYLFLSTLIVQNESPDSTALSGWLLALLLVTVAVACVYDRLVLKIVRWEQIVMSGIGIAVYVFAIGGWFATTTWYHAWYGTAALAIFALAVALFNLPPLPPVPDGSPAQG